MLLSQLASVVGASIQAPVDTPLDHDPVVSGISHQADWLERGQVFAAIRGARFDGHQFAAQAQAAGAVALMGEGWTLDTPCPLPYLRVPHIRRALAEAACALAGHPSRALRVVGITGTDGKTTTAWFARQLLRSAGRATGLLSTVGYELPDGALRQFPAHFTTPEAPQLQRTLQAMQQAGAQNVVLEASSHALALDRVWGVDWDVAVWTQLTSEHLDFHGSVEQYFAEKRKLIERAPFAILNADDPRFEALAACGTPYQSYSIEGQKADWQAQHIQENSSGLQFELYSPLGQAHMTLPMIGRFNVANALAALAAAAHLGASLEQLTQGLAACSGVLGRMQLVGMQGSAARGPRVVVDFAHTPDSLAKALDTLRPSTKGRLWVVIGSAGGLRDPSKRAPLGQVAVKHADFAVFTEEDYRSTPLAEILAAMQQGAEQAGGQLGRDFCLMADRREAIRFALTQASEQDTVLLAGKGAEQTLERGEECVPWNEVAEAEQALQLRQ